MLFSFSKIVGTVLMPVNLLALLLFLAVVASFWGGRKLARAGRVVSFLVALFLLLCAFLPIGSWALAPLENYFVTILPQQADGILLLTGDENPDRSAARGIPLMGHAAQRYLLTARLARRYPSAKIVVVGTPPFTALSGKITMRSLARKVLTGLGVSSQRLVFEEKSRTTRENILYTKKKINPKKGEKWLLVTSAFHLPRASLCFDKEGWETIPVAADYFTDVKISLRPSFNSERQLRLLTIAAHEYFGLVSYWLLGWINTPW